MNRGTFAIWVPVLTVLPILVIGYYFYSVYQAGVSGTCDGRCAVSKVLGGLALVGFVSLTSIIGLCICFYKRARDADLSGWLAILPLVSAFSGFWSCLVAPFIFLSIYRRSPRGEPRMNLLVAWSIFWLSVLANFLVWVRSFNGASALLELMRVDSSKWSPELAAALQSLLFASALGMGIAAVTVGTLIYIFVASNAAPYSSHYDDADAVEPEPYVPRVLRPHQSTNTVRPLAPAGFGRRGA